MSDTDSQHNGSTRRGFLANVGMAVGLIAGYGLGAVHFFRYLVPLGRGRKKREMFIGTLDGLEVGASLTVKDPGGQEIAVARVSEEPEDPAAGFRALSSKCPHLGCKVHWVPGRKEFYCPCHDGRFDRNGIALSGPPAKENKNLATFEVKVDPKNGWVFVMVSGSDRFDA